jgi:hypothetical protein
MTFRALAVVLAASVAPFAGAQLCFVASSATLPGGPVPIQQADMDGDGIPDVVVGQLSSGSVTVMLNNGAGVFTAIGTYPVGPGVYGVAAGDLDGDHRPDVVSGALGTFRNPGTTLSVRFNQGGGVLGPETSLPTADGPVTMLIVDLDGDDDNDLIALGFWSNTLSIFPNLGNGTFGERVDRNTGMHPQGVAVGDLSGDGRPDIVVSNIDSDTISVFVALPRGGYAPAVPYDTGHDPYYVAIAKLDGDDAPDVAVLAYNGNGVGSVRIFKNLGGGTLLSQGDVPTGPGPLGIGAADFDHDGDLDIATSTSAGHSLTVLLNDGNGAFPSSMSFPADAPLYTLTIADFNGDTQPDVAAAAWGNGTGNAVAVFLNCVPVCDADLNGDGLVNAADLAILLGAWGSGDRAADLDNDAVVGAADLAILLGAWGDC